MSTSTDGPPAADAAPRGASAPPQHGPRRTPAARGADAPSPEPTSPDLTSPDVVATGATTVVATAEARRASRAAGAAHVLLGDGAGEVLAAAAAASGRTLVEWHRHDVHARPGAETSVGYATVLDDGSTPYLVASTWVAPEGTPGVATLRQGGTSVTVWAHPDDPRLPALRTACTPELLQQVLRAHGDDVTVEQLDVVGYRPLRRAVVRAATADGSERWVKALRPEVADGLVARLTLLREAGVPVPATVVHEPGLVVLGRAVGRPVTEHLLDGAAPDPDTVVDLVRRLPAAGLELPGRPAVADRVRAYAHQLVERIPEVAAPAALVVDAVDRLHPETLGPLVVTHGDLHPANLWWQPDGVAPGDLALIDVDTVGPGLLVDDLATLVAHLTVLPSLDAAYRAAPVWKDLCLASFDRVVDPLALRARAAAVVLSLASGQLDEQLARQWAHLAYDLVQAPTLGPATDPAPAGPHRRSTP